MESTKYPFQTVREFYPFYLSQHRNNTCRNLHFVGVTLVILITLYAVVTTQFSLLWPLPVIGYGFAWVGHYGFEKNRPATFDYATLSLICDFVMFKDMALGRIQTKLSAPDTQAEYWTNKFQQYADQVTSSLK